MNTHTTANFTAANFSADIVVVGAGAAGCVLAARLSEDPSLSVLLLEAGGEDSNPWIHIPAGFAKTIGNPALDWRFETEPAPGLAGRRIPLPRGKVLGGTTAINGMLYIRGTPPDYDGWRDAGNPGWGWNDVLPYFIRAENNTRGANAFHGADGPLSVSDIPHDPLSDAFLRASGEAGFPVLEDFNGASQEGASYYQMMTRRGRRASTARAYLKAARNRANLQVVTGAQATRILFDGKRASGVEFVRGGAKQTAAARREVLITSGALQSPQLLQLSGIGPAELLGRHGIPVLHDLPGVGENLQDHLQVRMIYRCNRPVTINDILNSKIRTALEGAKYLFGRTGLLAHVIFRSGLFARSSFAPEGWPDLQIHFGLLSFDRMGAPPHPFPGFTVSVCQLRPTSRGWVRIGSNDPLAAPVIHADYLSTDTDCRVMTEAVQLARRIAAQPSLAAYIDHEYSPGAAHASAEQMLEHVRKTSGTVHHPVGTCRMGNDALAVVDHRLRVRGINRLRVIDGSVMPAINSGNTTAPIVMIGEKASDMIREDLSA